MTFFSAPDPAMAEPTFAAGAPAPLPMSRSSRDTRIDFFRGIALIGIALNHTVPPPDVYKSFGHYQFGHIFSFGFADVFVFLSGMVCAMAYTRVLEVEGFWSAQGKAIRQCMQIYVANTLAFLVVAGVMIGLHSLGSTRVIFLDFDTSKLQNTDVWKNLLWMSPGYNHFSILKFYVVMLMLMPLALWLYRASRLASIVPSLLAYGYVQTATRMGWPAATALEGPFGNYLAWQFLFFLGMWIGSEIKSGMRLRLSPGALLGLVTFLFACDYLRQMKLAIHHFDDKVTMGPLRIAELLAVMTLIGFAMPRDLRMFKQGVGAWLTDLGTRSLEIFALTLVSCYTFTHVAALLHVGRAGYAAVLLAEVAFVLLVGKALIALLYGRKTQPPRRTRATEFTLPSTLPRKAA